MKNLFIIYRIHLKMAKNKFINSLLQYPIVIFAGILLLGIIGVTTFELYANFVTQVNEFASNIDDIVINKITRNYTNILFISSIIIPYAYNTFYEGKDKIIELIYALPYDSAKMRKMWNMPVYSFITTLSLLLLTPYSLYVIRLNNISRANTIYILILQYIYMLYCLLFSKIITKLIKIILYEYLNVKNEYRISIYSFITGDIFILLVILLFNSNITTRYTPTQFIMNTIFIIKHLGINELIYNIIFNFVNFGIMIFLYLTISKMRTFNNHNTYLSEISNNIKIDENPVMVYLKLLTKKIIRNKDGLIGIISMFFIIIVVGYFIKSSDVINISIPQLYSFNIYFVFMLLGIYIIGFDDTDIVECMKSYNGNMILYNLIYIIENSLLILLMYFIEDGVLCLLCNIEFTTIFSISKINIFLFTTIAMLFKNLFINKDSSKLMQFIATYGFVISIMLFGYLGSKVSTAILIVFNNNTTVVDTIVIVTSTILFYFLQFAILKMKEVNYV